MKPAFVVILLVLFSGCTHYGPTKPNWMNADFNKGGEAYYLSAGQIQEGFTKDQVIEEYGPNYKMIPKDENKEIFRYTSYRATFATDPIDRFIYVTFVDGVVTEIKEVPVN